MDLNRYDVFVYQQQEKQGYQNIDDSLKRLILDAVSEVKPGDHVVIKPNLVRQCSLKTSKWEHVITNPLLIKAVLEAVILRLDNSGHIFVLDAPQEDSNFKMILKNTNSSGKVNQNACALHKSVLREHFAHVVRKA